MTSIVQFIETIFKAIENLFSSIAGNSVSASGKSSPKIIVPTLTPAQALEIALSKETNFNPAMIVSWKTPANVQFFNAEILTGQLNFGNQASTCGGTGDPGLNFQQASSFALSGGVVAADIAGGVAKSVAGSAVPGLGLVIGIIGAIFQHHKLAVQRDNAAQCALIPAANNAFKVIISGVQDGTIAPSDGAQAIIRIPDMFISQAGPAYNHSPYCNALCEESIRIRAIALYWQSQFQAME